MNVEGFRELCLAQPFATEDMPFDDSVVAFRLKNKIFAAIILDRPNIVVMKCEAERAEQLRAEYPAIAGAYHWNKKYWNQIELDGSVPDELIGELCRHAWSEVNKKLPKRERIELEE